MNKPVDLETIVNFAKRKGFVYPGSEIYGGLANTWDLGNLGVKMVNNLKQAWRKRFVTMRSDMVELDAGILMNQKVWEASGHVAGFADLLIDDKDTKHRFRADHLIEEQLGIDVEGWSSEKINELIADKGLVNPYTKKPGNWTEARQMNLMFETNRDKINPTNPDLKVYLRPETAQGIFVQFKNIVTTERPKLPFGVAQIGKAFRNEITPGNFIFRVIEFEQMEIEYFIKPPVTDVEWREKFDELLALEEIFLHEDLGISKENIRHKEHAPEKLSHYSKRTLDLEYKYPQGWSELWGLAYRTDYDLKQHQEHSGEKLLYYPPEGGTGYTPHVLEPSVGVGRLFLAMLIDYYHEEQVGEDDTRIVLKVPPSIAPYQYAVLPLMKKDGLAEKAQELLMQLKSQGISVDYDESGSVGKRYRRQDENGTPVCITIDYQTLEDGTVTVRDRDTMSQERKSILDLALRGQ
jgi:glycyl-tRNA synthetase